jgi:hypothetical protein
MLLAGTLPFYSSDQKEIFQQVLNKEPSFASAKWATKSQQAIEVIKIMLVKNPEQRCEIE